MAPAASRSRRAAHSYSISGRLSGNLLNAQGNWALDPETRKPNPD